MSYLPRFKTLRAGQWLEDDFGEGDIWYIPSTAVEEVDARLGDDPLV